MATDGYAVEAHYIQHLRSAGAEMQMVVLAAGVVFDWVVEPQEGLGMAVGSMESSASLVVSSCVKTSWRRILPFAPFRLVRLVKIWPEWWYPAGPGHVLLEGSMEMCSGWPFRSAHPREQAMERCSGSSRLADLKVEVGWCLEEFSQPPRPGFVHSTGIMEAASGIVHREVQVSVCFDPSLHSLQPGLAHPEDPMASLTLPKLARLVWSHFHSVYPLARHHARYHARKHPVGRAQSLKGPISEGGGATSSQD